MEDQEVLEAYERHDYACKEYLNGGPLRLSDIATEAASMWGANSWHAYRSGASCALCAILFNAGECFTKVSTQGWTWNTYAYHPDCWAKRREEMYVNELREKLSSSPRERSASDYVQTMNSLLQARSAARKALTAMPRSRKHPFERTSK